MDDGIAYVGLDVHKESVSVAVADGERGGEVRYWGKFPNTAEEMRRLVSKLAVKHSRLEFVYEAGPCGYGIYRQLAGLGWPCRVVAPSRIPRCPGDRVKNDHRDAKALARLARADELSAVWVPDEVHEAMRDLVRARHAAVRDEKIARQRIQSFVLRHGERYERKPWTQRHQRWLADRRFGHATQQIAFQSYLNAREQAASRRADLEQQIASLLPDWSLGSAVNALQALRGVGLVVAVTVISEVGDITRFENPKQLMAFLGLTPGEYSSGNKSRSRGITKAGSTMVRAMLYEAAWCYRQRPKVGAYMLAHMPENIPQHVKDIAWKAQLRLHRRYNQLLARGKKSQIAVTAVARELVGFMWSIMVAMKDPEPEVSGAA
jgi:transposase